MHQSIPLHTVSGMRPTGKLHLGHYFGAIKSWLSMQQEMKALFFVADWHALTSDYANTTQLKEYIYDLVIDWLASGVDPHQSIIFQQSKVPQHAELNLLLGMITPLSWLERNPTYKEQQQEITTKDLGNFGFLGYPVLMAADILLYRPQLVPVGQDQLPHLELTREIARRFNSLYGTIFTEPKAKLTPTAKCPGLDGRKMSKSYGNAIFLNDSLDEVTHKVKKMYTDPARLRKSDPGNPDVCNLFPYHKLLTTPYVQDEIREGCVTATLGCVECKKILLQNLKEFLNPFHERRTAYENKNYIDDLLTDGNQKATIKAEDTMNLVREAIYK